MASSLETYRKKRHFDVTSEPAPGKVERKKKSKLTFMIHKHDATRLHYDVRLEMEGVLASWAVPKGPCLDPSVRRLAVQTEDHPLEYAKFEGRIPEGEYGAGDSIIWDRGTWDTVPPGQGAQQRKKGHIHFEVQGEKMQGRWHLVRTRPVGSKSQWILFKAHDEFASTTRDLVAERPESVKSGVTETRGPEWKVANEEAPLRLLMKVWPPMLAVLGEEEDVSTATHVLELKYDGFRAVSGIVGRHVSMQSRNGLDLNSRFPEIAEALKTLSVKDVVLDGEVIALGTGGRSAFQNLQGAGSTHRYAIFDILWLDGVDLRARPLEERRELLERVLADAKPPLMISQRVRGPIPDAMERITRLGEEGLIAKRRGSTYVGERSWDWVKLKVAAAQELAILGYTPMKNGKPQIGALLVGYRDGEKFGYAGKVGTGFSSKLREKLLRDLRREVTDDPPVVRAPRMKVAKWVKPKLVAQIAFTEWTEDGKLRHPRFQGLRDDKSPMDVVREAKPERGSRRAPTLMAARTKRR